MKTAIITFQDAENFGAALQAYALKTILREFTECDVINYYNSYFHQKNITGIKGKILALLNKKNQYEKHKRFLQFQNTYITDGKDFVHKSELEKLNSEYDFFITGSDQVWNLECSGGDRAYFLNFTEPSKKASYAASFGKDVVTDTDEIKSLLSDFKYISVREKSGQDIIKQILGKDASVVLDPTLLLNREQWSEKFNLSFQKKYVLVYEVLVGDKLFEQAKQFAKNKGMSVVCITSTNKPRIGAKIIKNIGPKEWLEYFAGAAYVFTNSFHGLAFSINFNKNFFVEFLPPPAKTNTRIMELLKKTGLENRNSANADGLADIDYKQINDIIKKEIDMSVLFLKNVIKG